MYGENSGMIRAELTVLLRQHRIQQRLGGRGIHTVPETTTVQEREELGRQIARYRHSVLIWCLQAARAANPRINLYGTSGRSRGPEEELSYRLTEAVKASSAGLPASEELTQTQDFPIVDIWRLAARAAALGEHDFGAGVGYGRLSEDQCMTVLKDAAEVTRALVGLDRRYEGIPGWEKLKDQGRVGRAAEVCAVHAGYDDPDYTVDLRGWRPPADLDHGPALPGIRGVLQGESNLLVTLKHFPDAHSMRLVLDSQRIVSHEVAMRVGGIAPPLREKWAARADTFKALVDETRNVRGLLGNGGPSAAQAARVASRAQKLDLDAGIDSKQVQQLDQLFSRIDARLADVIEHGVSERLYFMRVKLPRIDDRAGGILQPVRTRYVPINSPVHTDLIPMVRARLQPPPGQPCPPKGAARSRRDFEEAITHRPMPRGVTTDGPSL